MAIKVVTKDKKELEKMLSPSHNDLKPIPHISGSAPARTNIIIRAIRIMLMDIRMRLYPKQTKEDLEKYSQFSDLVYGRR